MTATAYLCAAAFPFDHHALTVRVSCVMCAFHPLVSQLITRSARGFIQASDTPVETASFGYTIIVPSEDSPHSASGAYMWMYVLVRLLFCQAGLFSSCSPQHLAQAHGPSSCLTLLCSQPSMTSSISDIKTESCACVSSCAKSHPQRASFPTLVRVGD